MAINPQSRTPNPEASRSGQALLELVVGLVAILVLTAVILQLGRLQRAHTETLIDARAEAGDFAMQDDYTTSLPGPQYIRDWDPGGDQKTYSRDDTPQLVSAGALDDILDVAQPQLLAAYVPDNPISEYSDSASLEIFALVHGQEQSDDIPLLPIIQRLIYNEPSISMEANVWLTWTKGIE